jgi:hypothetical protein
MGSATLLLLLLMSAILSVAAAFAAHKTGLLKKLFKKKDSGWDPKPCPARVGNVAFGNASAGKIDAGGTGWKKAAATHYTSYAACCKKNPNYDPKASTVECDQYSACSYPGLFIGVDCKVPIDNVKNTNIAAFYDDANQKTDNMNWWRENVKGKQLYIRNPATKRVMLVYALDTCGNKDCGGCCSKNSKKGGGFLIDLEENTAKRFYDGKVQDESIIEWKWA